jgi:hypothetical protein
MKAIPPNKLINPTTGVCDAIKLKKYKINVQTNHPAKMFPHKRNDIEKIGIVFWIIFSGLIITGYVRFFILIFMVKFFKYDNL